ncbi:hypothetical protein RUND412_009460 [Rhizina undulata]
MNGRVGNITVFHMFERIGNGMNQLDIGGNERIGIRSIGVFFYREEAFMWIKDYFKGILDRCRELTGVGGRILEQVDSLPYGMKLLVYEQTVQDRECWLQPLELTLPIPRIAARHNVLSTFYVVEVKTFYPPKYKSGSTSDASSRASDDPSEEGRTPGDEIWEQELYQIYDKQKSANLCARETLRIRCGLGSRQNLGRLRVRFEETTDAEGNFQGYVWLNEKRGRQRRRVEVFVCQRSVG